MNPTICKLYEGYLSLTDGDRGAAASLTLADVSLAEPSAASGEELLTVRQAARRLSIGEQTVYRMCDDGRLRCQRLGSGRGTIRIRPKDLSRVEIEPTKRGSRPHATLAQLAAV